MVNAVRNPLKILGVEIGTYDGWDEVDTAVLSYYNIELDNPDADFGNGFDCVVDFGEGTITEYNDDGTIRHSKDLINFLRKWTD